MMQEAKRKRRLAQQAKNQREYAKRKAAKEKKTKEDVVELAYIVNNLEGKRQGLYMHPMLSTIFNEQRFQRVVQKYNEMFQNGYNVRDVNEGTRQNKFLRSIMHEDLNFFSLIGIDAFINTFQQYCLTHGDFSMKLQSYNVVTDSITGQVISCSCDYLMKQRITRISLETYYPHALSDEVLVQILIGKIFEARHVLEFYFDENGIIEKFYSYMDVVPAFVSLLGDVRAASIVVENNLLEPS